VSDVPATDRASSQVSKGPPAGEPVPASQVPPQAAVLKVWIDPGCIVCDACQTTCPEVFEVQEQTCVIRAAALDPEMLRKHGDAVQLAAEECPVEVIRIEMGHVP